MSSRLRRGGDGGAEDLLETQGTLLEAVSACVEILGRVAASWKTADRYLQTLDALSKAALELIQEQPYVGLGGVSDRTGSQAQASTSYTLVRDSNSGQPFGFLDIGA